MKNVKKILAIVLVLSLVLPIFSLTAAATFNGSIDTSDEPFATYSEYKESVAIEKYNILLAHWAYDKRYPSDEYADFPSFYGGAYIDDSKNLVIQLTSLDKSIIAYFKNLIDLNDVVFEKVEYSFSTLIVEKDAAVAKMAEANTKYAETITAIGLSMQKNAINMYLDMPSVERHQIDVKEICNYLTSFERINIIEANGKDQPAAAPAPGDAISISGTRSIGFWAYDSNGYLGIVTAPHDSVDDGDPAYIGGVRFGTASTPYCGGNVDAVFIRRTNSSFTPTRYIAGHETFYASGTFNALPENATAYSRGCVNNHKSGRVLDITYSAWYGEDHNNITINNCALVEARCDPGDSGGIVVGGGNVNTRYIVGIIAATQGNTYNLIYSKASYMISTLNCTIY